MWISRLVPCLLGDGWWESKEPIYMNPSYAISTQIDNKLLKRASQLVVRNVFFLEIAVFICDQKLFMMVSLKPNCGFFFFSSFYSFWEVLKKFTPMRSPSSNPFGPTKRSLSEITKHFSLNFAWFVLRTACFVLLYGSSLSKVTFVQCGKEADRGVNMSW